MELWRQVGIIEELGVAADGRQGSAQLVRHIADEFVLPVAFAHQLALLRLHLIDQAADGDRDGVCLIQAPVRGEFDIDSAAIQLDLANKQKERLGKEMPDHQAQHEGDQRRRHKQRECSPRYAEQEHADKEHDSPSEQHQQRRQKREVCL